MDVVTHIAVGAAIGEVVLGPQLGGRAILYGIAAGTLPDIDIVLGPLEDDVTFLTSHRGVTHCLLFVVTAGLLLGWLLAKWHRDAGVTFKQGVVLALAALLAHVLLDACTTYGTPLLLPLSDCRVAFNNLFIIDPLFTLPLLACVLIGLFCNAQAATRQILSAAGLSLCCLYLGWSCLNKYQAQRVFAAALATQHIEAKRFMTAPMPLNNVLWFCLAEAENGYWLGSYSLLAKAQPIDFRFLPRRDDLLADIKDAALVRRLVWFSDGYYCLRQDDGSVVFDVLKFGLFPLGPAGEQAAFSFALRRDQQGTVTATAVGRPGNVDKGRLVDWLWRRIWGSDRKES